ncbi:MAG: response regulator [Betaproteobacteria bacterium]|nr:response regulator [Betaproteobacteria bacterium]
MPAQSGLLHTWGQLRKKMQRSVGRLLATDSRPPPNFQHVHLLSFYRQVLNRGCNIAAALKTKFKTRYDNRLPLAIQGNARLLQLAVFTMLDRVMEQHPEVGYTIFEVNLTEEGKQDYVSFTVWHAGVRRSKNDGVRTRFDQNEMEQFVALMEGYFRVENQDEIEPKYIISIPLVPGNLSNVTPVPHAALSARLTQAKEGTTALVVDDSAINRLLGVHLLSRHNITTDVAENGYEALEKLIDGRYDLIFIDYSMPGLNGVQTAAAIRAREMGSQQTSSIIGMSFSVDPAENMEAAFLEAGMQGYLAKPVDPLNLNLLLSNLLPRVCRQAAEAPEQTEAPDLIDSERQGLIRKLSSVVGLDAEKGLANAGHCVEIYAEMLRRFTAELTDYIEPLLTLSVDGFWEEVAIRLHVLREFFVGIGAEELAQEADDLIAAADAGGDSECMRRIQSYCDAMMRLRAGLVGLKAANDQEGAAHAPEKVRTEQVDMATLKEHVANLSEACLSFRATEAQATADGLRKMAVHKDMEEQIEAICSLVDTLDFHEARERCSCLLEAIALRERGAAAHAATPGRLP